MSGDRASSSQESVDPTSAVLEPASVHPTALIEAAVVLGAGTAVWDHAHIRQGARLGDSCIVGGKTYIAYDVEIGDRVKINSFAYLCAGLTVEDGVMISAGVTFTNDRFPRAASNDLSELRSSAPDESTLTTRVRRGATLGARAVVGCDLEIGEFAMVGMGATVTRDVPAYHLVTGAPARSVGYVCRCGEPFARFAAGDLPHLRRAACSCCDDEYSVEEGGRVRRRTGR